MTNHFSIFNLTPVYGIDLAALEAAYFDAQRKYHPDRFTGKPDVERLAAAQKSADINQAYNALKNPLVRAQHLLQLQGITVGTDRDSVKPTQAILTEAMELRENPPAKDKLEAMIAQSIDKIGAAYIKADYQAMAQETIRLSYLLKARR